MRKWIWTFGCDTPYSGKYVVVECLHGDGRDYMFKKYGQDNCCMSYLYDDIGMDIVKKYGFKLIEEVKL